MGVVRVGFNTGAVLLWLRPSVGSHGVSIQSMSYWNSVTSKWTFQGCKSKQKTVFCPSAHNKFTGIDVQEQEECVSWQTCTVRFRNSVFSHIMKTACVLWRIWMDRRCGLNFRGGVRSFSTRLKDCETCSFTSRFSSLWKMKLLTFYSHWVEYHFKLNSL